MKNDKIKRVEEMEKIMDKSADIFRELNIVLDKLEENLVDYKKLDEYYSSENWFWMWKTLITVFCHKT